jgi:hypothetical protein
MAVAELMTFATLCKYTADFLKLRKDAKSSIVDPENRTAG